MGILATIFAGGNGILINDLSNGTIVELISDYKPPINEAGELDDGMPEEVKEAYREEFPNDH